MMENFEKELANAYGEAFDVEIDAIIAESEKDPHEFSPKFEESIAELIKSGKPKKERKAPAKRVKRILIIAIAAVLALVATACAVPEIRESIAGFFVRIFSDHVEYTDPTITKEGIEEEYCLLPIPEGFELISETLSDKLLETIYADEDGNVIMFHQSTNDINKDMVDNEHGEFFECEIGGKTIQIHHSEEGAKAAWVENGYYFSIDYGSSIELDVFKKWIESVAIK